MFITLDDFLPFLFFFIFILIFIINFIVFYESKRKIISSLNILASTLIIIEVIIGAYISINIKMINQTDVTIVLIISRFVYFFFFIFFIFNIIRFLSILNSYSLSKIKIKEMFSKIYLVVFILFLFLPLYLLFGLLGFQLLLSNVLNNYEDIYSTGFNITMIFLLIFIVMTYFFIIVFIDHYSSVNYRMVRLYSIMFLIIIELLFVFVFGILYIIYFLPIGLILFLFVINFKSMSTVPPSKFLINKENPNKNETFNDSLPYNNSENSEFTIIKNKKIRIVLFIYIFGYISNLIVLIFESLFSDLESFPNETIYNYFHQPVFFLIEYFLLSMIWPILYISHPITIFSLFKLFIIIGLPIFFLIDYYKLNLLVKNILNNNVMISLIFIIFPILIHIFWISIQIIYLFQYHPDAKRIISIIIIQFLRIESILGWNIFLICYLLFLYFLLKDKISKQELTKILLLFIFFYYVFFILLVYFDFFQFVTIKLKYFIFIVKSTFE